MPTTRYGVSVRPNDMKRYAVSSSASPVLSQRKRYGVLVDNKLIVTKQYPFKLVSYSRRSAREEELYRATRREREYPASLFVRSESSGTENEYHAEITDLMHAEGNTILSEGVLDAFVAGAGEQREWVAPLTYNEPSERLLDVEMDLDVSPPAELRPRERFIRRTDLHQGEQSNDLHVVLNINEATERQNVWRIQRNLNEAVDLLRPVRSMQLDPAFIGMRKLKEYQVEKTDMDATDTPYIFVYEHQLYRTQLIEKVKPVDLESMNRYERTTNPTDTYLQQPQRGEQVANTIAGIVTDPEAGVLYGTTTDVLLEPQENVRVLEHVYASTAPELFAGTRDITERAHLTHGRSAFLQNEDVLTELNELDPTAVTIRQYETQETTPSAGPKHLPEFVAQLEEPSAGQKTHAEIDGHLSEPGAGTIERQWNVQEDMMHTTTTRYQEVVGQWMASEAFELSAYTRDSLWMHLTSIENQLPRSVAVLYEADSADKQTTYLPELMENILEHASGKVKTRDITLSEMIGADMNAKPVEESRFERVRLLEHETDIMLEHLEQGNKDTFVKEGVLSTAEASTTETQTILVERDDLEQTDNPDRIIDLDFTPAEAVELVHNTVDGELTDQEAVQRTDEWIDVDVTDYVTATGINEGFSAFLDEIHQGYVDNQWVDGILSGIEASTALKLPEWAQLETIDVSHAANNELETYLATPAYGSKERSKDAILPDLSAAIPAGISTVGILIEGTNSERGASAEATYTTSYSYGDIYRQDEGVFVYPDEADRSPVLNDTYEHVMQGFEKVAYPVEESRYERTSRQTEMRQVDLTLPDKGNREQQLEDVFVESLSNASSEFAEHLTELDAYTALERTVVQDDAQLEHADKGERLTLRHESILNDYEPSDHVNQEEEVLEVNYETSTRENQRDTLPIETFGKADRMHEELALSFEPDSADRQAEEEAIRYEGAYAERMDGTDAYFEDWVHAQRYAWQDTEMVSLDHADRNMLELVRIIELEEADRNKMVYTEWMDYDHGEKTMKFGVLVDDDRATRTMKPGAFIDGEQADRLIKTLPTYNEDMDSGKQIIKTKKKIWLIPAHGNHWNNWSGWKKTR